jgi:hypothetical protein
MWCWYCGRYFRPFEFFYIRRRYSRGWSTPRRYGCADCRAAGWLDAKIEYSSYAWPILGAKAR